MRTATGTLVRRMLGLAALARRSLALAAMSLALGCKSASHDEDPFLVTPGTLPTPYSAAQIRAANPPGASRVYLVTDDGTSRLEATTFLAEKSGDARFRSQKSALTGALLEDASERTATWPQLQAHAAFPSDSTTRGEARCTTAAGVFDCWYYEKVDEAAEGGPRGVHRFWFAKDLAGPPVLYELCAGDALVYRMELVEFSGVR